MINTWKSSSNNWWNPDPASWNMVVCPLYIFYESLDPSAFYQLTTHFICLGPEDCGFHAKFRSTPVTIGEGYIDHVIETLNVLANQVLVYVIRFQVTSTSPYQINYYRSVNKVY